MASFTDRLSHAWNVFRSKGEDEYTIPHDISNSFGHTRPDRIRPRMSSERSIIASVYNRLGIDVAANIIRHVRLDPDGRYLNTINSGLNHCLSVEANIDQAGRAFRQDLAMSLFENGVIAVVPIETTIDPSESGGFDIRNLRIGKVVSWYPQHVRVNVYNELNGNKEDILVPKKQVAIIENPLYSVMNEPNSTLQRLIRKLNILDAVDEASGSGKLDIIIQLPYTIKSDARREQAEKRRSDIEFQLRDSKYGIAYADSTERITQLNRPAENNMLKQIQFLTEMLYGQLGLTPAVFDGTASEAEMLNYHTRTIEPILDAIVESFSRSFLTKTARSQNQAIRYFREPFKLVPVADLAEIADKMTRNEIMSSNELRAVIGLTPSKDPNAEELRNKNLPQVGEPESIESPKSKAVEEEDEVVELKQIKPKRGDLQNGT